jgi:hypothetical protein
VPMPRDDSGIKAMRKDYRSRSQFDCAKGGKHVFDMFDFDSGDDSEYGHCVKCGCWIDTDTGKNETKFEKEQEEELVE